MNIRILIAAMLPATLVFAAAPNAAQLDAVVKAREQRTTLLRDELKAQDARIEARIEAIVAALQSVTDSKDSRTKVTRVKEATIDSLAKNLEYFRQKRASLIEELRRPKWRLTDEQKRKGIEVFDAHIEKRVAQIVALQKSMPTHKDYERYNVQEGGYWGPTYTVNEDYKQNQRLTSRTSVQRGELEAGLRKSIERLDQQNRQLKSQGAPAEEIAKNEALAKARRKQLDEVLTSSAKPAREIGKKEAADLDAGLRKASDELRREFDTLFARYNALIPEFSALNAARDAQASIKQ